MKRELNKLFNDTNYDKENYDNKRDMINQTWVSKPFLRSLEACDNGLMHSFLIYSLSLEDLSCREHIPFYSSLCLDTGASWRFFSIWK